jgi:hypothetical protein
MAANIEEQLIEKARALPPDKQMKLLEYADDLARPQNGGVSSVKKPTIWEMVEDIIREVPEGAWDEVPRDGSLNVDHYLYGAPKRKE